MRESIFPCPRCDWPVPRVDKGEQGFRIVCDGCGHCTGFKETPEDAVADWNAKVEAERPKDCGRVIAALFKKDHNFRRVPKTCGNCKFGNLGYEGEVDCEHPTLEYHDEHGESLRADIFATESTVCDLWEKAPWIKEEEE